MIEPTQPSSTVPNSRAGRLVVLDFYRYVAAVGVFVFHVRDMSHSPSLNWVGSYGLFVDMFFILSGFVIFLTYGEQVRTWAGYRGFLVRRVARVYPLHVIVLALFVLYAVASGTANSGSFVGDVVTNFFLLQAWGVSDHLAFNTPAWSISGELLCYLLFPLLAVAFVRLRLVYGLALVGICYVDGAHGHLPIWDNKHSQIYGSNFDFGALRALVGFMNGIVLCRIFLTIHVPQRWALTAGVTAMVVAVVCMTKFAKPDLIILLMAGGVLATALGERDALWRTRLAPTLEWFGDTSYAIYMIHWMVVAWLLEPMLQRWPAAQDHMMLILAVSVIGLTLISHFVFTQIEAPARRWITRTYAAPRMRSSEALVERVQ